MTVPGYLGRILDDGDPVGTCFQVAPGVLVTAWHVLNDIGAAAPDSPVQVDPLPGGDPFEATVARLDATHDLAVLVSATSLPATAGTLTATDQMTLRAPVTVTGHAEPQDQDHTYRFLNAPGEWAGWTTRDDTVPLGRMTADALVPGMSGAPVVCDADGAVAGVVSGRYNTADGWLAHTVWVARSEDLAVLLDGVAGVAMRRVPLAGPADLLLTIDTERVRLSAGPTDISAPHGGVRPGLAEAVNEARRARARIGQVLATPLPAGELAGDLSLARAGRLLGESFLPGPVAAELTRLLAEAEQAYQPVRLGVAAAPELAWLPWEALPRPDGRGPLALHPLVRVYRQASAAAPRLVPGPLRIVVAIAAPLDSGGGVVDYERHLRSVIAEVRSARQDDADVRVIPFAVLSAIREELQRAPAHVLHVYCHGSPGRLELEDQDGNARLVGAEEFLAEAIPPGAMPPVITLSACYTDAAAADGASSFAAALGRHGACAVIGTETSVTDVYATRLFARLYGRLAQPGRPDVIAALADARREVQRELETSTSRRDQELAALGEWAIVTVLAAAPEVAMLDPDHTRPGAPPPDTPSIEGLAARGPWYFVGRRAEQRRWPAELTSGSLAGIVGMLAQDRGEYDEAARQYQRSLDINEQLGDQAGLAASYHQLGMLAQDRGDYDEAARQYQRSLDTKERLGDQAGLARSCSQLGILETDRGGSTATAIAWHVKALVIRLHLGVPQAQVDLSCLSDLRRELGVGPFNSLLAETVGDAEAAEAIISLLDQLDNADGSAE